MDTNGEFDWITMDPDIDFAALFAEFDTVEPAVIPVLLGAGIPMLPSPASQTKLSLTRHRLYPESGIVLLEYSVDRD